MLYEAVFKHLTQPEVRLQAAHGPCRGGMSQWYLYNDLPTCSTFEQTHNYTSLSTSNLYKTIRDRRADDFAQHEHDMSSANDDMVFDGVCR